MHSVPEVIARLSRIVDESEGSGSRVGYFAALYRRMTVAVFRAVENGAFENRTRMERLDVTFALRYFDALERFHAGGGPTHPWRIAFRASRSWFPTVVQHLILGVNAHILLDLGIAAYETAPGTALRDLKPDFDRVNSILEEEVHTVRRELAEIWPLMRLFSWCRRVEDDLVDQVLIATRVRAWELAEELNAASPSERSAIVEARSRQAGDWARDIWHPGWLAIPVLLFIRLFERGNVAWKIRALAEPEGRVGRP